MAHRPVPDKYRVPALERVATVLDAINRSSAGMRSSELARVVDLPKSTLHNLLLNMESMRLLTRDPESGRLNMGIRLYEWGTGYIRQMDLVGLFHHSGAEMVKECRETVQLAVLDDTEVVYLAKHDPEDQAIRLVSEPGRRLPAQATALGKAMLSRLDPEEVTNRFRHVKHWPIYTPHTISDLPTLIEELKTVRDTGIARDRQEAAEGLECVAAPVLNQSGHAIAAVSIAAPVFRLTNERRMALQEMVHRLASQLSQQFGHGIK